MSFALTDRVWQAELGEKNVEESAHLFILDCPIEMTVPRSRLESHPFEPLVLTENLVSDCFGIDECKALAKAAVQRDDLA
jgi:hypothetical protein